MRELPKLRLSGWSHLALLHKCKQSVSAFTVEKGAFGRASAALALAAIAITSIFVERRPRAATRSGGARCAL